MRNSVAPANEAKLGGIFENCQTVKYMQIDLATTVHSQPPTPMATDNRYVDSIMNGLAKHK